MGLFFCLPLAIAELYNNDSLISQFAVRLFEVTQLMFTSVLERADIDRLDSLCRWLLPRVPDVFVDFGNKPKFHYALAHCA